jgi:hypothetical protein
MTGIAEPGNIEEYVRNTWGDANSCMNPNDRAEAVVADVNVALQNEGIPAVGWRFNAAHGTGAVFAFQTGPWSSARRRTRWTSPTTPRPDQQAWQISAVYHEARHAEQWFRMARERIGLGATSEQAAQVMDIPDWVAQWAAQNPINQCDASQYEAEEWYRSVYGEGADARNQTLSDVQGNYDAYRSLPEESDAWSTGDAVTAGVPPAEPVIGPTGGASGARGPAGMN